MVLLKVWFFLLDFFVSKTFAHNVLFCNLVIRSTIMFVSWRVIQSVILPSGALQGLCRAGFFLYGLSQPLRQRLLMTNPILLPPFPKSRNTWPQSTVTGLLWTFLRMTTGLRGGICRKRTSPIKHSYFFGTEEVLRASHPIWTIFELGESPQCPRCFKVSWSFTQPVGTMGSWQVKN